MTSHRLKLRFLILVLCALALGGLLLYFYVSAPFHTLSADETLEITVSYLGRSVAVDEEDKAAFIEALNSLRWHGPHDPSHSVTGGPTVWAETTLIFASGRKIVFSALGGGEVIVAIDGGEETRWFVSSRSLRPFMELKDKYISRIMN